MVHVLKDMHATASATVANMTTYSLSIGATSPSAPEAVHARDLKHRSANLLVMHLSDPVSTHDSDACHAIPASICPA